MDKKLKAHHNYIKEKIEFLRKTPDTKLLESTIAYHENMVKNFQHERLVHLTVTLFFVSLTLALLAFWWLLLVNDRDNILLIPINCLGVIVAILAITDVFYVRHYYRLENGTEKLYNLTKELYKLKGV
ncbi:MAG: hypothetical protein LBH36_03035 [Candidatus Nomurabacteria bacterium]|jgi:hypothetical protein|nr:hypothetical protein [Candidatus Nomurabacteria bacterium]